MKKLTKRSSALIKRLKADDFEAYDFIQWLRGECTKTENQVSRLEIKIDLLERQVSKLVNELDWVRDYYGVGKGEG